MDNRRLLPIIAAALLATGCDTFTLTDQFERRVENQLKLTLSPTGPLTQGDTVVLTASGGTPPYTFTTDRGNSYYIGSTGSTISGSVFTAGDSIGPEYIHLEDSAFQNVHTTVTIVPPKPTGFVADGTTAGPQTVTLTWNAPTHLGITGFRIERTTPTGFDPVIIDDVTNTSYLDTTANPNENTYRLYTLVGQYQSPSAEASALGNQ